MKTSWPLNRRAEGAARARSGDRMLKIKSKSTIKSKNGSGAGFTLMEMLVVIGIIVLVLGIALPNLRGYREGSDMEAAARQLISDLSIARARAINGRTTVLVVFVPSDVLVLRPAAFSAPELAELKHLRGGVYTEYALFSFRRVGDQPGRSTPRYLTEWKSLPEKTFIAEGKFAAASDVGVTPFDYAQFPFPLPTSTNLVSLPYVAFNYEGRLCKWDGGALDKPRNVYIPLARGAILYGRDATGDVAGFTVQEVPPGNSVTSSNTVVLDWLTGRGQLQRAEVQSIP
jgi:prepilin-type N-terminal cleavage/methylation domain-containing protein